MQKLRLWFRRFPSFFVALAIFSVSQVVWAEEAGAKQHENHHAQSGGVDWPGLYNGVLPCSDCIGIKTSLALNKNNSYILIYQYLGKSPREFVEKGKFTWSDKADTIVLTPRNGAKAQQYLVGENMLIQLDADGNRISGKQADRYILRRMNVTDNPPDHSSH